MGYIKRNCDNSDCGKEYMADERNLNRGWGKCCSKSCAAKNREKAKLGYDPKRVADNNVRRVLWNDNPAFTDSNQYGTYKGGRTSEGYKVYLHGSGSDRFTAIDEYGEPVYDGNTWDDDMGDSEYWDSKDY